MDPKAPPVMQTAPWEDDFARRIAERFGPSLLEASSYAGQNFLVVEPQAVVPVLEYLLAEEQFDYLVDVTAVDYPDRERRFDLIYVLYSFARNVRIRLKTAIGEAGRPQSASPVYPAANWLEREIYDMFGIEFAGHPNLTRILLPEDWTGHPLRKDYGILQMDNQWVRDNLGIESGQ